MGRDERPLSIMHRLNYKKANAIIGSIEPIERQNALVDKLTNELLELVNRVHFYYKGHLPKCPKDEDELYAYVYDTVEMFVNDTGEYKFRGDK